MESDQSHRINDSDSAPDGQQGRSLSHNSDSILLLTIIAIVQKFSGIHLLEIYQKCQSSTAIDSCLRAFVDCHTKAHGCRSEAEHFVSTCSAGWNSSSNAGCDVTQKESCRNAMRRFYAATLAPDVDLRLALLFCRCSRSNIEDYDLDEGQTACRAIRGTFQRPVCTAIELPPPDCRDIIDRCDKDDDCK